MVSCMFLVLDFVLHIVSYLVCILYCILLKVYRIYIVFYTVQDCILHLYTSKEPLKILIRYNKFNTNNALVHVSGRHRQKGQSPALVL